MQALSSGQTAIDAFIVRASDGVGGTTDQPINVTVQGTNDAPAMIEPPVPFTSFFVEDQAALMASSASLFFSDPDLNDTHAVSARLLSATTYSGIALPDQLLPVLQHALNVTLLDDATNDGFGKYSWNFALDNSAVQFLGQFDALVLTYETKVTQWSPNVNSHASATESVTVTIGGNNDPVTSTPVKSIGSVGVLVFSDFNQEGNGDHNHNNEDYNSFQNWTVPGPGSVDLYYGPNDSTFAGQGGFVDLQGTSTGQPGALTSKMTFGPGTYELSFDIGGTGRMSTYHNGPDGVHVSFGSYDESFMPPIRASST